MSSSQAAVAANREKRTPARADAASEPPWSVGAAEGEAVEAVGEPVGDAEGEAVGAAETVGEAVGAQVSVTPHEVASQTVPLNVSMRIAVTPFTRWHLRRPFMAFKPSALTSRGPGRRRRPVWKSKSEGSFLAGG